MFRTRKSDIKFDSLDSLYERVHSRRMVSRAIDIDINRTRAEVIDVDGESELVINSSIDPVMPTHWSFGQMATRVGAPANYLRELSPELVRDNLNYGLERLAGNDLGAKFMVIDEGNDHGRLQAVTSPTYGRIWDAEVVSAVRRIADASPFTPVGKGLTASDRDVYMFLADMTRPISVHNRANLFRGVVVYNSEVGSKAFAMMTFLFNSVCSNGLIMGMQGVDKLLIRHTSGGPSRFDTEAIGHLRNYIEASPAPIEDAVKGASGYRLPDPVTKDGVQVEYWRTLHDWVTKKGMRFTKMEIRDAERFAIAEEGQCASLWDLVQGLTASARALEWADARADLQARAGKLMNLVK